MSVKPKIRLHPDDLEHLREINDRTRASSKNVSISRRSLALILMDYAAMRNALGGAGVIEVFEKQAENIVAAETDVDLEDIL